MSNPTGFIVIDNLYKSVCNYLHGLQLGSGVSVLFEMLKTFPQLDDNFVQAVMFYQQHQSLMGEFLNGDDTAGCLRKQKELSALILDLARLLHRRMRVEKKAGCYGTLASEQASVFGDYRMGAFFSKYNDLNNLDHTDAVLQFLWTMPALTPEAATDLRATIASVSQDWKRLMLAGVYLSLTEYFDYEKYLLLLEYATSGEMEVRVDAMVFLLLVQQLHPRCLALYPDAPALPHDDATLLHLKEAQRAMIVESASSKYVDFFSRNLLKAAKEKQGVVKMVKRAADLPIPTQIDLNFYNMTAFYSAKFFTHHISLWWMPYRADHPLAPIFPPRDMEKEVVDEIQTVFCPLDRYVLCYHLQTKEAVEKAKNHPDEMDMFMRILSSEYATLADYYSARMQNLYRFYTFSHWKDDFVGITDLDFYLAGQEQTAPYFSDEERLIIHKSLMAMNAFSEALHVAHDIKCRQGCDADLLRNIGLCHQKACNYKAALQAYTQAFLMDEEDLWTLKRMQECNKKLGRYAALADCLQRRIRLDAPHEVELTLKLAGVYKQLEQYEEALSCYYKVHFMDNGNTKASNGILFCLFMLCRYDKVRDELQHIREHTAGLTPFEYVITGHVEWVEGHFKEAFECYKSAGEKGLALLEQHVPYLHQQGISQVQYHSMVDCLLFFSAGLSENL